MMVRTTRSGSSTIGRCPTPGQEHPRSAGQAFACSMAVRLGRNESVELGPGQSDRARQRVQRLGLLVGGVVIHERAVDGIVRQLQGPRGGKAVTVTRALTQTEAADYCEPEHKRRYRPGDARLRAPPAYLSEDRFMRIAVRPEARRRESADARGAPTPGQLDGHPCAQR